MLRAPGPGHPTALDRSVRARFPDNFPKSGPDRERIRAGFFLKRSYEEIQVFGSIAERTGVTVDRADVRGQEGACRSLTELIAKARRMGDGYYYLASTAWPADQKAVSIAISWTAME